MIKITPDEIKIIAQYLYQISGIAVDEKKAYLIETRLSGLVEESQCRNYLELYQKAKSDTSNALERKIINAMTTNETLFFRDHSPFELFRHKLIPELIDKRSVRSSNNMPINIRIWSAACSTGQEVYSLAIVLKELLPDAAKYKVQLTEKQQQLIDMESRIQDLNESVTSLNEQLNTKQNLIEVNEKRIEDLKSVHRLKKI